MLNDHILLRDEEELEESKTIAINIRTGVMFLVISPVYKHYSQAAASGTARTPKNAGLVWFTYPPPPLPPYDATIVII